MKKLSIIKCGDTADKYGVGNELDRPGELRHQVVSMLYDIINDTVNNYFPEDTKKNISLIEKITGKSGKDIINLWKNIDKKWGSYIYTVKLGKFVAALREMGVILNKKYESLVEETYYEGQ